VSQGRKASFRGEFGTKDNQNTLANGFRTGAISGLVLLVSLTLAWLYFFLFEVGFPGAPPSLWWAALVSIVGCLIIAFYTVGIAGIGGIIASSLSKRGIISPGNG
jgi:magnesium-transporting ATPase (P-type)